MARDKEKEPNPVFRRFLYNAETKKSKCTVGTCSEQDVWFSGQHAGNLTVHLERYHKDEFEVLTQEKKAIALRRQAEATSRPARKKRKIEKSIEVFIDEKQIIDGCTTLVTLNGRPFKMLDDSGFRMILDPILKGLGNNLTISAENIVSNVNELASDFRKKLKAEIANRRVCLKVDCAKRLSRSILGINVQFVKNGKIVLRTLSTYELNDRQTGVTLKRMILDVLKEHEINMSQVYSITTDNGANIVLAVKLLVQHGLNLQTENNELENEEGMSKPIIDINSTDCRILFYLI